MRLDCQRQPGNTEARDPSLDWDVHVRFPSPSPGFQLSALDLAEVSAASFVAHFALRAPDFPLLVVGRVSTGLRPWTD